MEKSQENSQDRSGKTNGSRATRAQGCPNWGTLKGSRKTWTGLYAGDIELLAKGREAMKAPEERGVRLFARAMGFLRSKFLTARAEWNIRTKPNTSVLDAG